MVHAAAATVKCLRRKLARMPSSPGSVPTGSGTKALGASGADIRSTRRCSAMVRRRFGQQAAEAEDCVAIINVAGEAVQFGVLACAIERFHMPADRTDAFAQVDEIFDLSGAERAIDRCKIRRLPHGLKLRVTDQHGERPVRGAGVVRDHAADARRGLRDRRLSVEQQKRHDFERRKLIDGLTNLLRQRREGLAKLIGNLRPQQRHGGRDILAEHFDLWKSHRWTEIGQHAGGLIDEAVAVAHDVRGDGRGRAGIAEDDEVRPVRRRDTPEQSMLVVSRDGQAGHRHGREGGQGQQRATIDRHGESSAIPCVIAPAR